MSDQPESEEALSQKELQRHFSSFLKADWPALFKSFTGLTMEVVWAPAPPLSWPDPLAGKSSAYCRLVCSGSDGKGNCGPFTRGQLKRFLEQLPASSTFACPVGVYNGWVSLKLNGRVLGLLTCQAFSRGAVKSRKKRLVESGLPMLTRPDFNRAVGLLELMADDVMQKVDNTLSRDAVRKAVRAVHAHEELETRLRREVNHLVSHVNDKAPTLEDDKHGRKKIRKVLNHMHAHYHEALQLQELGELVGLSACYLSSLFKEYVGIGFREYLKDLRLEKAQQLLADFNLQVSEVAYAVGYMDANSFRLAFKKFTGLSPSDWRETLKAEGPEGV